MADPRKPKRYATPMDAGPAGMLAPAALPGGAAPGQAPPRLDLGGGQPAPQGDGGGLALTVPGSPAVDMAGAQRLNGSSGSRAPWQGGGVPDMPMPQAVEPMFQGANQWGWASGTPGGGVSGPPAATPRLDLGGQGGSFSPPPRGLFPNVMPPASPDEAFQGTLAPRPNATGGAGQTAGGFQAPPPGLFANYSVGPMDMVGTMNPPAAEPPMPTVPYTNPGAYLPGGQQTGPLTQALTSQMLERPSARTLQDGDFAAFMARMPRSVSFSRAPEGSLDRFNATGGNYSAESDAALHDRALGAFLGLDKVAGGSEKMALDKFLGVGKLGNETTNAGVNVGQLDVARRAQNLAEYKGANEIDQDQSGAKLMALLAAQGKSPDEQRAALRLHQTMFQKGVGRAGGFQPGQPFATPPQLGGSVQVSPAPVVRVGPRADTGPSPAPDAGTKPPPKASPAEHDPSEDIPWQAVAEINGLAAKGGASVGDAAKILARHMDVAGMEGQFPKMLRYLTSKYGDTAVRGFAQPNPATRAYQRFMNTFTAHPSEDEVVASKLRNAMGLDVRRDPLTKIGRQFLLSGGGLTLPDAAVKKLLE